MWQVTEETVFDGDGSRVASVSTPIQKSDPNIWWIYYASPGAKQDLKSYTTSAEAKAAVDQQLERDK